MLGNLWSFSKGPRRQKRLENLGRVPKIAAVVDEVKVSENNETDISSVFDRPKHYDNSLSGLYSRRPDVRLVSCTSY